MKKKSMCLTAALVCGLFSGAAHASKALAPGNQVIRDFSRATGFRQWLEVLTKNSVPGDYQYIQQTFKAYPNLGESNSLPKVNFEKDTFQIHEGLSEVTLRYLADEPHAFFINNQRVEFGPYELASQKMKKILSANHKSGEASHFLLLPIAWAQESNLPTKTSLTVLAITSAVTTMQLPAINPHLSIRLERLQGTSSWKTFNEKNAACLQKIHDVEDIVYGQEQLDFQSMECSSMGLKVHLGGVDQHGPARDFVAEKDGFYIEQGIGKHSLISRYSLVQPDPITKKGDDPTSLSSSPAQREAMGGEFVPVGGADRETMYRYMGSAVPAVRNFCSTKCASTLKAYWKILQSVDVHSGSSSSSHGTH